MVAVTPELIELDEQHAIVVRGDVPTADLPDFFGHAFTTAMAAAEAAEVEVTGPPFGYYPEMPAATVVVEAGFPVSAPASEAIGDAHPLVLRGGRVATVTHVGPYETMESTYAVLMAWMTEQGLVPAGDMWETYLSGPESEPDPATWRTQIFWPVA